MLWGQPIEYWETTGVRLMFAGFFLAVIGAIVAFGSSYILWKVGKVAQAPRELSVEQTASIVKAVAGFEGLRVVLGAVPPSANNTNLTEQILVALRSAQVDVFINHAGVAVEVDPSKMRGRLSTEGIPVGVTVFYVTGNARAEAFSMAVAKALNEAELVAAARDNWREQWVISTMKQHGVDRNDKQFEPVTIVVGDKP